MNSLFFINDSKVYVPEATYVSLLASGLLPVNYRTKEADTTNNQEENTETLQQVQDRVVKLEVVERNLCTIYDDLIESPFEDSHVYIRSRKINEVSHRLVHLLYILGFDESPYFVACIRRRNCRSASC
jgi:hypothetical protein